MSRSAYYRQPKRLESKDIQKEQRVVHCFKKHDGNYGRKRICKVLCDQGIQIKEHKVGSILRKNGLFAKGGHPKRKHPKKTEAEYLEDNLLKDKFSVTEPNYLWCSDITELRYAGGRRLYVCGIIDVASRRIVGWSISRKQRQNLVQDAFEMAIGRNPVRPEGAIYHSDRGSQYTARRTKELIEKNRFRKSMSPPGSPNANQPIESFWMTMKRELPDITTMCYEEAKREIVKYIELYYNAERLHSGIGYYAPNDYFTLLCVHGC